VRHAKRTGLYDELLVADLVSTMNARPDRYDLIAAADVLSYFGDLNAPLRAASRALKRHGYFVFTVEALDPAGGAYRLCDSRRYQHSLQYLRAVAATSGLRIILEDPVVIRKEQNRDVRGFLLILAPS
jgi:predicted TPR repeat methyltransferase